MLSEREFGEFKRGPLQMLVLFLLSQQDMYGYQIAQEIKARSGGKFAVSETAFYVVLYRLIDKGLYLEAKGSRREKGACLLSSGTHRAGVLRRPLERLPDHERRRLGDFEQHSTKFGKLRDGDHLATCPAGLTEKKTAQAMQPERFCYVPEFCAAFLTWTAPRGG